MPSVRGFAECKNTGTRQIAYLPNGRRNALGKTKTLGKRAVCRVSTWEHSANHAFAECLLGGTRQTVSPRHACQRCCAGRDVCRVPAVMFAECLGVALLCMNSRVFTSYHPNGPVLYVKQEENGCLCVIR